jgi:glutamine amidotransferase-like uncharacterized protein
MQINIYQDYINNNGVLFQAASSVSPTRWVDAWDIAQKNSLSDFQDIFIMPGGASRFYAEKLDGAGTTQIRHFVEQGGVYLGICAGAYFAARDIAWTPPTGLHIHRSHELGFYDGVLSGPMCHPDFKTDSNQLLIGKMRVSGVLTGGKAVETLYWSGPIFDETILKRDNWQVWLQQHQTQLPPIIAKKQGKGLVVLSSPHPEYESSACRSRAYHAFSDCDVWQHLSHANLQGLLPDLIALIQRHR